MRKSFDEQVALARDLMKRVAFLAGERDIDQMSGVLALIGELMGIDDDDDLAFTLFWLIFLTYGDKVAEALDGRR